MPNICSLFCCGSSERDGYTSIEDSSATGDVMRDHLCTSSYLPHYAYRQDATRASKSSTRLQSMRVADKARVGAFKAWSAVLLEDKRSVAHADPSLLAIQDIRYYCNNGYGLGPQSGVYPTSIFLTPQAIAPWDRAGILTFDFDMTITKKHTYSSAPGNRALRGYNLDNAGREANLRHPEKLRQTLVHAKASNICVTVATRHDDMPHVLAYLQTLVTGIDKEAKIEDYFSVILCSFTLMNHDPVISPTVGGKDGELAFLAELLLRGHEGAPVPMALVDDDMRNQPTKPAQLRPFLSKLDIGFIHAPEAQVEGDAGSDAYLTIAQQFITRAAPRIEPVSMEPSSSSSVP